MIRQSLDTSLEAEEAQLALIREASIAKRIALVRSLSQTMIQLARRAIKRMNPELNDQEINLIFIENHYGQKLAKDLQEFLKENTK
ncbi:MAG: hypothetical protein HOD92_05570 [Deltaproteobacteria bacterium]|jgi:hypothetical protein|nr:hypothetical protein [Deltaproteobacteria bacterium]MBT4525334.1 hypothetical protein [Deltaproteobacteria bacterium]